MKFNNLPMVLISLALLPIGSCEKAPKDTANTGSSEKTTEPFVIVPKLVRNDGSYQLLSLIEGVQRNAQFAKNLQIVNIQRAELKKLKDKEKAESEKTPQAPELAEIKAKAADLEKKLGENAQVMLKTYGYNISSDYLFVPINSSLVKVVGEKKELVKHLGSPKDYKKLQAMRSKYSELTRDGSKESPEAKDLAAKLMAEFTYDVNSTYVTEISKSALYLKLK